MALARPVGSVTAGRSTRASAPPSPRSTSRSASRPGCPSSSTSAKRSRWPSRSGKVPAWSNGFCVAMSTKGLGSGWLVPSTDTCRSSIASSSADCERGVARFTSSVSTTLANSGPGRNSHVSDALWNTETPVSSLGKRSGVAWMRRNVPPTERASALARSVFPCPGTSSISRCPPDSTATTARRRASGLPRITPFRFSTTAAASRRAPLMSGVVAPRAWSATATGACMG